MANKPVSFRPTQSMRDRLDDLAADDDTGTGKALETAADVGLAELGYGRRATTDGGYTETALKRIARPVGLLLGGMALACIFAAVALGVDLWGHAVALLLLVLGAFIVEQAEPGITRLHNRYLGGDEA